MDILSATNLECLNKTLSYIYSVLQLHLCPWCSEDQQVLVLVWIRCLNKTLSYIYSVLQLHLCPWCSEDQQVLVLVWIRETILGPVRGPVGPRSGKARISFYLSATLIEVPHPQEVNYLAAKEAPSSDYLWRYNYSEYGSLKSLD